MLFKLTNMKLGLRLGLGFLLIIAINVGNNLYSKVQMDTLAGLTEKLYNHPYTVSTALLRIDGGIVRMHRSMKDVALAQTPEQMQQAQDKVDGYEKEVYRNFDIVDQRFLGDKADVVAARKAFADWKVIRDEVIAHMKAGERPEAAAITKGKGA